VSGLLSLLHLQTPALFDKEEVRERLRRLAGGPTQPLTVHLRQEIDWLNIVIKLTTTTLQNLRLAIAGTIALSGTLIESLDALFMARIPVEWLKKSWEVCGRAVACACRYMLACVHASACRNVATVNSVSSLLYSSSEGMGQTHMYCVLACKQLICFQGCMPVAHAGCRVLCRLPRWATGSAGCCSGRTSWHAG
jgi:hypothetical protein